MYKKERECINRTSIRISQNISLALETLAVNFNTRPEWILKVPPEAKSLGTFFLLIGQSASCIRNSLSFASFGKLIKAPKSPCFLFFLLFTFLQLLSLLFLNIFSFSHSSIRFFLTPTIGIALSTDIAASFIFTFIIHYSTFLFSSLLFFFSTMAEGDPGKDTQLSTS